MPRARKTQGISRGTSRGGRGRGRGAKKTVVSSPTEISSPSRSRGRGSRGRGSSRGSSTSSFNRSDPAQSNTTSSRYARGGRANTNSTQDRHNTSSRYESRNESRSYGNNGGYGGGNNNDDRGFGNNNNRRDRGDDRRGGGERNEFGRPAATSTYMSYNEKRIMWETSTERHPEYEKTLFENKMSVEVGINFDNYDEVEVEITGENAPEGLENWQNCDFSPVIRFNLTKCGFKKPTPIQKWSVPCVRNFRNLMACAQTGSGKTAAFLVPTIDNLLRREDRRTQAIYREPFLPRCLVFAPTRELAQQIHEQARKFLYCTGMRACCAFGGQKAYIQLSNFKHGMDVLIATPGRLNDMVNRGNISLAAVQFLILDEADRMLDMGFEPQIREIIESYDCPQKEDRTTLMFSATFPSRIQELAEDFMGNDYLFLAIGRVGAASEMVTQELVEVSHGRNGKFNKLMDILNETEGKVLVFTRTKRTADDLYYDLEEKGHRAEAIHGDKTQGERESALRAFKTGKVRIMVGTDVCARGLDIPNVEYVIQYDLSDSIDDHVHRIGRTGRCGNKGTAIGFVKGDENIVRNGELYNQLEETNQTIPQWFNRYKSRYGGRSSGGGRSGRFGGRDRRKY